jgi:hypothetical protein
VAPLTLVVVVVVVPRLSHQQHSNSSRRRTIRAVKRRSVTLPAAMQHGVPGSTWDSRQRSRWLHSALHLG